MSTADRHAERAEDHVKLGGEMPDYAPLTAPTLLGLLQERAARHPDRVVFSFSRVGDE
jgi:hypothetical protein